MCVWCAKETIVRFLVGLLYAVVSQPTLAEWDSHGWSSRGGTDGGGGAAVTIAMLHMVPIIAVAMTTHSKALTILAAFVMAGVAVLVGGPVYALLDLFFVGLGLYFGSRIWLQEPGLYLTDRRHTAEPESKPLARPPLDAHTTPPVVASKPAKSPRPEGKPNNLAEAVAMGVSNTKAAYAAELLRQQARSDAKLAAAAERAAERINQFNQLHADKNKPTEKPVTSADILAILNKKD
jgi:hypothetical protein